MLISATSTPGVSPPGRGRRREPHPSPSPVAPRPVLPSSWCRHGTSLALSDEQPEAVAVALFLACCDPLPVAGLPVVSRSPTPEAEIPGSPTTVRMTFPAGNLRDGSGRDGSGHGSGRDRQLRHLGPTIAEEGARQSHSGTVAAVRLGPMGPPAIAESTGGGVSPNRRRKVADRPDGRGIPLTRKFREKRTSYSGKRRYPAARRARTKCACAISGICRCSRPRPRRRPLPPCVAGPVPPGVPPGLPSFVV